MSKSIFATGMVVLAAVTVSGCQSSPLAGWSFNRDGDKRLAANPELDGPVVLEEGRRYLRDGNISKAVASFQLARLDKASAAAANNGLAVSYARLGRADLAERYFRTAATLDPNEPKYVANLLRLQGNMMLAKQARVTEQLASAESVPSSELAAREDRTSEVHRVSHGEFRITTTEPAAAPTMQVSSRQAAASPAVEKVEPKVTEVAAVDTQKVSKQFEVVFGKWLQK
ncbi:hypothetical protein [Qipengyuania sp. RANM35]|uniref:tetratricopeptide repeat protein n=1 Tax=Qipengyuania sp. RANM35 TaxID=3068635 RepID=UPI0034DB11C9